MVRRLTSLERYASITLLGLFLSVSASAQTPSFKSFNTNDFIAIPPMISLRYIVPSGGTNITITNLYVSYAYISNLFVTNITAQTINVTSNLTVNNTYTTNLYATYEVVSNIVAGNIQGTVNRMMKFTPDGFSGGDSDMDNPSPGVFNTYGTNSGSITLQDTGVGNTTLNFGTNSMFYDNSVGRWRFTNANPAIEVGINGPQLGQGLGNDYLSAPSSLEILVGTKAGLQFNDALSAIYPTATSVGEKLGFSTNYYGGLWLGTNGLFGIYSDDGTQLLRGSVPSVGFTPFFGSGVPISTVIHTNIFVGNMDSGVTDIYTVPVGYKFWETGIAVGTTNASSCRPLLKTNGAYFVFSASASLTTNNSSSLGNSFNFVFEAGESISITNGAKGVNAVISGYLLPNTSPLKTVRKLGFTGGTNAVYTVPTGKYVGSWTASIISGVYWNNTASTTEIMNWFVPNGGSLSDSNKMVDNPASVGGSNIPIPNLSQGDTWYFYSSYGSTDQMVFATILEQ